ncbi:MAG TPA: glycosyltransferase family 87 protein [Candidatus Limnocylindrales bacterium]|nr:glycosyltransferase family 87 protein [Candidatus Limnocylindrales bacterium]
MTRTSGRLTSFARLFVQAILIGLALAMLIFAIGDWSLSDAHAYWEAAWRIREGEELYPAVASVEGSTVYRYSPWFAMAAVPFTYLPPEVAGALWSAILIAASIISVAPLARSRALILAFFFGCVLIGISAIGNAQPLVIAALVWGLERRSGPLWIAAAASLKAVPILFAFVYLGRRQWGRFALSLALTGILVAPFLLYDLSNYVTSAGFAGLLITWPPVYVLVVGAGVVATVRLARGRFGWLAAATTVSLALPRFFVYDLTFLLPGTLPVAPASGLDRWKRAPTQVERVPEPDAR